MLRFTKSRYIIDCVERNVISILKNLVTSFNKILMSAYCMSDNLTIDWSSSNIYIKSISFVQIIYCIHNHKMPRNALFFISKWPKINEVCSWIFILQCGPLNWFSGFKVMRWQVVSLVYFMEHIKSKFNTKT